MRRSEFIDEDETGGIGVDAVDPNLLGTLEGTMIGAVAGLCPAIRAARMSPTEAPRSA